MDEDQVLAVVAKSSLPLHCRPAWRPLRSFLQYWHTVGGYAVDDKCVRHFNFGQQDLVELDGIMCVTGNLISSLRPMKDSDGDFCYMFERQQRTIDCKRLIYMFMCFNTPFWFNLQTKVHIITEPRY